VALRFLRANLLNRAVAAGIVFGLLACKPSTKAADGILGSEVHVRLPAAEVVFVFPSESVAQVPPERMLEVVRSEHVIRPDSRFLGAIVETRRVLQGKDKGQLRVTYASGRWTMTLDGDEVGSLSDTASYPEALELLRGWSTRLLRSSAGLSRAVPQRPETAARQAGAEDPFSQQTVAELEKLDAAWGKGKRTPETLDLAGRELMTLCLQSLDHVGVADGLYAKTLALLAVREAAQGGRLPEEESLLASLMGYQTDAEILAEPLPESSSARLWSHRDAKRFREQAERGGASRRLRYLYLLRLASETRMGEWAAWLEAHCPELRGGIPLARAALEVNDFGPDRMNAELMLHVLSLEMTDAPSAAAFWRALLHALDEQPATRDLAAVVRKFAPFQPAPEPGVLERFERGLTSRVRGGGLLLDADTERAFYRSLFYSALYTIGSYELDRRGSAPDALAFAASLEGGPPGPAADFSRWFTNLARARDDNRAIDRLIEDLDTLDALGQPAIERVGDEVLRVLPANDPRTPAVAVKYGRRLDARPRSRLGFGVLCLNEHLDIPCYERYYGSAAMAWGRQWYATFPGFLRRAGGRELVVAMAADASVKASSRLIALEILEKEKWADQGELTRQALRIVEENPDDIELVDSAYRFLRDHGRLKEAEQLERNDLRNHPEAHELQKAQRASRLAEVLVLQGRNDEAWQTIEPWIPTGKSDVFYAAAISLEALGRHDEAMKMARDRLDRYPDERFARAEMAELLWLQNRASEVPILFKNPRHAPAPFDWKNAIGPSFREAFAKRSIPEIEAGFAPLVSSSFNPWYLAEIAEVMSQAGRNDAAFALTAAITARQPGVGAIDPRFNAYRYRKAWKGEADAVQWVRATLTPEQRFRALEATIDEGLLDLFWQIDDPPEGPHGADNVKLLRAIAFALAPAKAEARREGLLAYFQGRKSTESEYGQFLLGATSQADFLKLAADPARRGAVAYYVGLRSIGLKEYEDASYWLLIALQTATPNTKEAQSAKDILYRWARDGSSFERMKDEPLY
jgi:Tetratricopeptide repeat